MFIKGAKTAAFCPKMRHSPKSLARRLASPFFLPETSSYHEVLTVAQQAKASAACAEAEAARPREGFCHAAPRLSLLRLHPPPRLPITLCAGTSPAPVVERREGTRRQQRTRFHNDMDKATRAAIARAYEANRGDGWGESGAREGAEGGSEGGSGAGG